jgi:hypothetical protein
MLDPRKVRGLLKTIREFDGFLAVTVSDGETTVSVTRGAVQEQDRPGSPKPGQGRAKPKLARNALSSLTETPPAGVYDYGE